MKCTQPALIVEGPGDVEAVPLLIRTLSQYQINPLRPMKGKNAPNLDREGELERFVTLGLRNRQADSVLIMVDTDELCAFDLAKGWLERIENLAPAKKVAIAFFVKEFESLFLACMDIIAEAKPEYGWNLDEWSLEDDPEIPRGAKERISKLMRNDKSYKETTDQAGFVAYLDGDRLQGKSRTYRHLKSVLEWLTDETKNGIYPIKQKDSP